jgi:hypothetical protein
MSTDTRRPGKHHEKDHFCKLSFFVQTSCSDNILNTSPIVVKISMCVSGSFKNAEVATQRDLPNTSVKGKNVSSEPWLDIKNANGLGSILPWNLCSANLV